MIRVHVMGQGPPDPEQFADALRAIADDIASGGWSGDSIVDVWSGRSDSIELRPGRGRRPGPTRER